LLPLDVSDRAAREIQLFFAVWLLTLAHAALRPARQAWVEQLAATALLCLTLPLLNLSTTGDWLFAALVRGDGETAGVELSAIAFGLLCGAALHHLRYRASGETKADAPTAVVEGA
jgi:hypothetical protein